jgi:hypothetical protein
MPVSPFVQAKSYSLPVPGLADAQIKMLDGIFLVLYHL